VLSAILCSAHNVRFYQRLMWRAREAIAAGSYAEFQRDFLEEYGSQERATSG
jgi:queuine tRNA-ribosyltransferase